MYGSESLDNKFKERKVGSREVDKDSIAIIRSDTAASFLYQNAIEKYANDVSSTACHSEQDQKCPSNDTHLLLPAIRAIYCLKLTFRKRSKIQASNIW